MNCKNIIFKLSSKEEVVILDEKGNYYYGDSMFQYTKIHGKYSIGTAVTITKTKPNTESNKDIYPHFIIGFNIVNYNNTYNEYQKRSTNKYKTTSDSNYSKYCKITIITTPFTTSNVNFFGMFLRLRVRFFTLKVVIFFYA